VESGAYFSWTRGLPTQTQRLSYGRQSRTLPRRFGRKSSGFSAVGLEEPEMTSEVRRITYPFPLRPDLVAELRLPENLSLAEARRLSLYIRSLVPGEPSHAH
jgi:hypothetical protein